MSKNYAIAAQKRDRAGKGVARALRRENKIPGVIYGDNKEAVSISLPEKETSLEYNKGHMFTTLCDLDVDGDKYLVLARDIQLDPVRDTILHIDFLRVSKKTKLKVNVPVKFINEENCPALDQKAVMNVIRHEAELFCSAINIPEFIEVNLEGKEMGDSVKISDAIMPEGSTPVIDDRDFTIANLTEPRRMAEPTTTEGDEGEAEAAAEGEEAAAEGDSE